MSDERIFWVRMLWVNDPELLAEYRRQAKPIVAKHEVHIDRWLITENMYGNGFDRPDEIVVTSFRNAAAKDAFDNDPDLKKVAELRDRAAKVVTITAKSVYGS